MSHLNQRLTLISGTLLFMNIVIGAGLLSLPGLVYEQVGQLALYSWFLTGLLALPMVIVFILLGTQHPDSGGIAHYALKAYGQTGELIAAFILLGAISFGLPAIALTGAYYVEAVSPFSFENSAPYYAGLLILVATLFNILPSNSIVRMLNILGSGIILALLFMVVTSILGIHRSPTTLSDTQLIEPLLSLSDVSSIVAPFMMIFFAFTGWEIGAHASEEFKRPQRDFPLAMIASYLLTILLYGSIAWVVQSAGITTHFEAPFIEIMAHTFGTHSRYVVSVIAILLVIANLFGAIWVVSRLVYSLARRKVFHQQLARHRHGIPVNAILFVSLMILSVALLSTSDYFDLGKMLALAGQNFLILYGISALCLMQFSTNVWSKGLAIYVFLTSVILVYIAGINLYYPIVLTCLAVVISITQKRRINAVSRRH